MLNRMASAGARMVLSGDLNITHRRRKNWGNFARQVFSSGRGRAQITALNPRAFSAFTLLPPATLLLAVWAAFSAPGLLCWGTAAYSTVSVVAAAFSGARPAVKPMVFALFPVLHISYAIGWLCGALEGLLEKMSGRPKPGRCYCEEKP